jgi:hypothetical protein
MIPHLKHGAWQTALPSEEGDWIWIRQWSCGCCLIATGIAEVSRWDGTEQEWAELTKKDDASFLYATESGKLLLLGWGREADVPEFYDGKPVIDWWQKVTLPPYPYSLQQLADPE